MKILIDGYINMYSEPGQGTTFRIYLPLITSQVSNVLDKVVLPSSPGISRQ